MNFSKFFITRPIFAAVLSLVLLIAGSIALFKLPISEYPEVVPPTVVVRANFPGANPKVIGETVAAPLEQPVRVVVDAGEAALDEDAGLVEAVLALERHPDRPDDGIADDHREQDHRGGDQHPGAPGVGGVDRGALGRLGCGGGGLPLSDSGRPSYV